MDVGNDSGSIGNDAEPSLLDVSVGRHACERCHRRKQKCDRKLPSCTFCSEASAVCKQRTILAGGNSVDSPTAAFVGEGYIRSLKRSIEHLETRQSKHQRRGNSSGRDLSPQGSAQPQHHYQATSHRMSSSTSISVKDALADFGHFGLNSSPAHQKEAGSHDQQTCSVWTLIKQAMIGPDQRASPTLLDLRRDVLAYIDVRSTFTRYLDEVLPRHPFMSRAALTKQYEHVLGPDAYNDSMASLDPGRKHTVFIIYLVLSTACPRQGKSMRSNLAGSDLSTCAADILLQLADSDTIRVMQALTALVIFAYYRLDLQSMTYLMAIAISRAISAGYHQPSLQKINSSAPDRLEQAQVFSTLYMMDRTVSSVMDRPPIINDNDISEQIFDTLRIASLDSADRLTEDVRLLACLRRKRSHPTIFFTSIYRAWFARYAESAAPVSKVAQADSLRFKCRFLVALNYLSKRAPLQESSSLALEPAELHDAMQTCLEWLQHLEVVFDTDHHMFDALLAFEITSVALLCGSVFSDPRKRDDPNTVRKMQDIHILSISLLSCLASILPEAASMRRVLSKLAFMDACRPCLDASQDYESLPRNLQDMLGSYIAMATA